MNDVLMAFLTLLECSPSWGVLHWERLCFWYVCGVYGWLCVTNGGMCMIRLDGY